MCGKAGRDIQACPNGTGGTVSSDHPCNWCTVKLLKREGRGVEPKRRFRVDVTVLVALEMMSSTVTM
jgi:hypothetical protein